MIARPVFLCEKRRKRILVYYLPMDKRDENGFDPKSNPPHDAFKRLEAMCGFAQPGLSVSFDDMDSLLLSDKGAAPTFSNLPPGFAPQRRWVEDLPREDDGGLALKGRAQNEGDGPPDPDGFGTAHWVWYDGPILGLCEGAGGKHVFSMLSNCYSQIDAEGFGPGVKLVMGADSFALRAVDREWLSKCLSTGRMDFVEEGFVTLGTRRWAGLREDGVGWIPGWSVFETTMGGLPADEAFCEWGGRQLMEATRIESEWIGDLTELAAQLEAEILGCAVGKEFKAGVAHGSA